MRRCDIPTEQRRHNEPELWRRSAVPERFQLRLDADRAGRNGCEGVTVLRMFGSRMEVAKSTLTRLANLFRIEESCRNVEKKNL